MSHESWRWSHDKNKLRATIVDGRVHAGARESARACRQLVRQDAAFRQADLARPPLYHRTRYAQVVSVSNKTLRTPETDITVCACADAISSLGSRRRIVHAQLRSLWLAQEELLSILFDLDLLWLRRIRASGSRV